MISDHFIQKHLSSGILLCLISLSLSGCIGNQNEAADQDTIATLEITNSATSSAIKPVIGIPLSNLDGDIHWEDASFWMDTTNLPAELVDEDGDGKYDLALVETRIPSGASRKITIQEGIQRKKPAKRTHAEISVKKGGTWKDRVYEGGAFQDVEELAVPPEHTDHSYYIRYEGPGWESEKVGYRFYLDWRNAIDIFGKKNHELVLNQVGQDGFDSYHEMAHWGMDILKVGEALGLGALGYWHDGKVLRVSETDSLYCEIPVDGALQSSVRTTYYGWSTPEGKTKVVSNLSIRAGDRKTKHVINLDPAITNLCTGIVKHDDADLMTTNHPEGWNYLATWGKQSLAEDLLGMVIFFRQKDLSEITGDEFNHVVSFNPADPGRLSYYFAACWEQEKGGIKTKGQFEKYLEQTLEELNHPVKVKVE